MLALTSLIAWFDNKQARAFIDNDERLNFLRCVPFIGLHVLLFAGYWIGVNGTCLIFCLSSYFIRMFAITAFFHRYFSHNTFKTSKIVEILFGLLGTASAQRGPIWWAAHHRRHHQTSDTYQDTHSPHTQGFLKSHMLWFMSNKNYHTQSECVSDLLRKQHLLWIDRFDGIIPFIYMLMVGCLGAFIGRYTSLPIGFFSAIYWGFIVSTVLVLHATFAINSFGHYFGKKVYATGDESRNNWLLAIITLGEGWHNNHHHWPISAKQGFSKYQIDISYYLLVLMRKLGIVSQIKNIPNHKIDEALICELQ